ncbi:hypothetical protein DDW13_08815 [Acidianus hospitalis]|jgi:hypothetical protein|uniref:Uncharacterized protein n=3 Tax=Acidianus TaxID=12914 RepID=A0A2T9X1T1_9CREN|nr:MULTISPECIES: hypothetical protein [Acidianus]AEE94375.1 conserved hypothetical protein [Acidianus hospitalis W1]MUM63800.1 hypothetical protein [Acidianus infernus]PVU74058.1 hypothetical protein DDW13_08815 [Acidianus hospitalis]
MDFLDKKKRLVLIAIAQKGTSGLTYDELLSTFLIFMTRNTLQSIIEDLYFSGYINILRDDKEVRLIASRKVRSSLVALDFQRYKLLKFLEEVKKKSEEISKLQDKNSQLEEIKKIGKEGLELISSGLLTLYKEFPEFTIPEYIEIVEVINNEVLAKLSPLITQQMTEEDLKQFLNLTSKYLGEKEAEVLSEALKRI